MFNKQSYLSVSTAFCYSPAAAAYNNRGNNDEAILCGYELSFYNDRSANFFANSGYPNFATSTYSQLAHKPAFPPNIFIDETKKLQVIASIPLGISASKK